MGWGGQVCVIQFIKGYSNIGESHFALKHKNQFVLKQFALDPTPCISEADVVVRKQEAERAIRAAEETISGGKYDLVILDEVNNALHYGLIELSRVLALISKRPSSVEIILTGRCAPAEIVEVADYVTDMNLVKHPFQHGVAARKGIDY